jgi:hypothetical protein
MFWGSSGGVGTHRWGCRRTPIPLLGWREWMDGPGLGSGYPDRLSPWDYEGGKAIRVARYDCVSLSFYVFLNTAASVESENETGQGEEVQDSLRHMCNLVCCDVTYSNRVRNLS